MFHARIQICYGNNIFFYKSLNIHKAVSPYPVCNKVKRIRRRCLSMSIKFNGNLPIELIGCCTVRCSTTWQTPACSRPAPSCLSEYLKSEVICCFIIQNDQQAKTSKLTKTWNFATQTKDLDFIRKNPFLSTAKLNSCKFTRITVD